MLSFGISEMMEFFYQIAISKLYSKNLRLKRMFFREMDHGGSQNGLLKLLSKSIEIRIFFTAARIFIHSFLFENV